MLRALVSAVAIAVAGPAIPAAAQDYPTRPVRVIVGFAAGSGPDIQARTVSQELGRKFGQTFFVENRTGANGTIAARIVATAEPDGYTLLFTSSSIVPTPYVYKSLGYDTLTDLRPIATVGILDGLLILVKASSPIRSVRDLIERAKKERVLYGSPGVGNILHVATETFSQKAGIRMQHVPYKGASEVSTALLGDSIDVMLVTPPSVIGLLKDGKVRAIAFTGSKPFPAFPNVPLLKDQLPGWEPFGSWGMFLAPGKTPPPLVEKLNAAIREALQAPAVANIMQRDGYIPDSRTAAQAATFFRAEVERAGAAVRAAGIAAN